MELWALASEPHKPSSGPSEVLLIDQPTIPSAQVVADSCPNSSRERVGSSLWMFDATLSVLTHSHSTIEESPSSP
eukprot:5973616-Amphidinium_carterae.1